MGVRAWPAAEELCGAEMGWPGERCVQGGGQPGRGGDVGTQKAEQEHELREVQSCLEVSTYTHILDHLAF